VLFLQSTRFATIKLEHQQQQLPFFLSVEKGVGGGARKIGMCSAPGFSPY